MVGNPLKEANKNNSIWGGFIDKVDHFDNAFFTLDLAEKDVSLLVQSAKNLGVDAAAPKGAVAVSYSDVTGGYAGTGNIDSDPNFIPAPTGTACWSGNESRR